MAEFARDHANYYADLAGSARRRGALEELVELIGADRIVYGSDSPLFGFAYQTGRVLGAGLAETDKHLILRGNAERLFGGDGS